MMTLRDADRKFATASRIKAIESFLKCKKSRRLLIKGLAGSSAAMLVAGFRRRTSPYLIITDDADTAGYLFNDLSKISGGEEVAIFPSGYKRDIRYAQPDPASQILRTETLDAYVDNKLRWVVTYPEALAEKVPVREKLAGSTLCLSSGGKMDMDEVVHKLLDEGFKSVDYVYEPGQFARRGSILDVFSYNNELPYRIDFFDDEIDSVRTFNVETQLSEETLPGVNIVPAASHNSEDGVSLLEFIDDDTVVISQSLSWMLSRVEGICGSRLSDKVLLSGEGDLEAAGRLIDFELFKQRLGTFMQIEYGSGADVSGGFEADAEIRFDCSPQALYHKNFDIISESFRKLLSEGYEILLLSDSVHQADRLRDIFRDRGEEITFEAVGNTIHEGFIDNELKVCYFTDHQIFDRFHKYNLKSDRARSGKVAMSLKELSQIEPGDYIVHTDHGIGRFGGLVHTDMNGKPQEMIKLIYQNDDQIFVSIHALHKLSKYRGKEGLMPKINKLGSGAWNKLKDRTKRKVKDIARDLIKLYAARREEKGFSYSPDTYMQHELEASFIYEDTPDQLKATNDVKKDMESARPMDRLVCGDVGFGKTEIAIRAAFKAAADGKQTAVLVPTTVLAMQHYRTFSERLKDMPVRVEFLSRARKGKDVKEILSDLEAGKIDILIGTHKLIGKSVKFHDLGLLIIDEEQKFGVTVKEKLKQMKVNVDTLTMSATPIPRTLQFSLMGARDLSSLNTPPANRQPIVTTVAPLEDELLKDAIGFEVSRSGQVFMISNRIENLHVLETKLNRLMPDLRVVTAHGQMPPEQLEKAILDFSAHDYDVLLSTTIIENGIDMPNVNTIIVNNAQNFGLSELHQLRGRVGRSSRKAFCYLLVPPGVPLTPVARRRLQAIESFSELGSGIHIAMQDLDIRGAGNLLGAEQSGFIADLGYETYQKLLKESVIELKTEEFADEFDEDAQGATEEYVADCTIESDLELRLPAEYVPQESERITLYQRLDNMEEPGQIEKFRKELRDRFGAIPGCTDELINVVPLRMSAKRLGIERLTLKNGGMSLFFVGDDNKAYYQSRAFGRVLSYLQLYPTRCSLRERNGKRSMRVDKVSTVSEALNILRVIESLSPS
ncbi:MAG: transcription-repair coupling factor [Prevotella sp.]|nr:transcription-repair coupling factor [Bacteroides sp.]MCM1366925.1 transcription-repair coupling factor [Prevotella sp.]MCM1437456.1 transcription-repair coupling factor [Prevotella sp.]